MGTAILFGLIGGIFGGGLIVGVIEIFRYNRERSNWKKEDQKIDISIINAHEVTARWSTDRLFDDNEEKVRLYESGLLDKVSDWKFIIMISLTNLTNQEILAHKLLLEQLQPKMTKPRKEDKKYFLGYKNQVLRRYNLLTKEIIEDHDLPLVIPAHGKSGIVYVGDFEYDYPNLVEDVPNVVKFVIEIENNERRSVEITLDNFLSFSGEEIDFNTDTGETHWVAYLDKNNIDHGIPF